MSELDPHHADRNGQINEIGTPSCCQNYESFCANARATHKTERSREATRSLARIGTVAYLLYAADD
eukprot:scaffold109852_cov14-Prasinocladus_malaysianus.AAC.1